MDGLRLDHLCTVVWDPGIVGSRAKSVCYDCLCLMALFRAVMSLVHHWAEWSVWTGLILGIAEQLPGKNVIYHVYIHPVLWIGCVVIGHGRSKYLSLSLGLIRIGTLAPVGVLVCAGLHWGSFPWEGFRSGCFACGGGPVDGSDWPRVDCAVDFAPGGVWIGYIRQDLWGRSLTDAAPVTGSLVFSALSGCLDDYCATGFTLCRIFCSTECVLLAGFGVSLPRVSECWTMATKGAALVGNRAGITFGVELYVPWDAPEAVVDISSEGVVPLRSIPDVTGLTGRRADAVECRVLQGRDVRSIRVLVPDPRGLDKNFHDVTIVDMGDVSESSVSIPDLSSLNQQWPQVISHMGRFQQELEGMREAAKQRFRQVRPSSCVYCGIWIKCDMYRHVARFHLDLAQLWRCPVSWCTVWKGTPQDCMDHVRGHMIFRGTLNRPAWNSFFRRGQFDVRCGWIP